MPPPFKQLQPTDLAAFVEHYLPFRRKITEVHLHHTWWPNHSQYKGHQTIVAMYDHHTKTYGWSDFAQHATVAPDGTIWLGRNWDAPPASASGYNGSATHGPFMIAMIGDFDSDVLQGPQRKSVVELIARIQLCFNLSPDKLRFHNEMSGKSCPGSGIDRPALLKDLKAHIAAIRTAPPSSPKVRPFDPSALQVFDLAKQHRAQSFRLDPADAELKESEDPTLQALSPGGSYGNNTRSRGGVDLTSETLAELRRYVINLTSGMLSSTGIFTTDKGDVDAIFQQHLPAELKARQAAKEKLRILFYAHGGLVSESNALKIAATHIPWWTANGVYPIYFAWETGLFETVGAMLQRAISGTGRGTRDFWDHTTDPFIERAARALYGERIWTGMKQNAMMASSPAGGANYAAQQLAAFLQASGGTKDIELHAVGHSAGSIFHSHFVPTVLATAGGPTFRTLHFMAPAIRVDEFKSRLAGTLGTGVEHLSMFTMKKDFERDDNCMVVYRKSLLYLIHHALEPQPETPILGLQESVLNDRALQNLFGLRGTASPTAEVIWSTTRATSGRSATRATKHGDFDNDPPTMESILRRVIDLPDTAPLKQSFPRERDFDSDKLRSWEGQVDWPEGLRVIGSRLGTGHQQSTFHGTAGCSGSHIIVPASGNRRALCVGINNYGGNFQLRGCVADAIRWKETLESLGFHVTLLTDEAATRQRMLSNLRQLVETSQPGDVIVFQFAGHGTQLPDHNGDEATQDERDTLDEAFVPIDFDQSACILDDDIAAITAGLPARVNLTHFIDCCHSGTSNRMFGAGGGNARQSAGGRSRFMVATQQMKELNKAEFRRQQPGRIRALNDRAQRDILFSACTSRQTAKEHYGHGDFTIAATQVLARYGINISHAEFLRLTTTSFTGWVDQTPELWCDDLLKHRSLLLPF